MRELTSGESNGLAPEKPGLSIAAAPFCPLGQSGRWCYNLLRAIVPPAPTRLLRPTAGGFFIVKAKWSKNGTFVRTNIHFFNQHEDCEICGDFAPERGTGFVQEVSPIYWTRAPRSYRVTPHVLEARTSQPCHQPARAGVLSRVLPLYDPRNLATALPYRVTYPRIERTVNPPIRLSIRPHPPKSQLGINRKPTLSGARCTSKTVKCYQQRGTLARFDDHQYHLSVPRCW